MGKQKKKWTLKLHQVLTIFTNFYNFWHESRVLGGKQNVHLGFLIFVPKFYFWPLLHNIWPVPNYMAKNINPNSYKHVSNTKKTYFIALNLWNLPHFRSFCPAPWFYDFTEHAKKWELTKMKSRIEFSMQKMWKTGICDNNLK